MQTKAITHDHQKIHKEIYGAKSGPVRILHIPQMKYVTQEMDTAYYMDWAGRPEPMDQQWVVWKIVNRLKHITKTKIGYKFKLMPHEIIWHEMKDNLAKTTQVMQVPDCITDEMFEEARSDVAKKLKEVIPETRLIIADPVLCVQKLHVGHYRDTKTILAEIIQFAEEKGFKVKDSHREIYLTPAMKCHEPSTWKTIVRVELTD
ncbi:hypothetical protein [Fictibacillus phosphorivorans]|uniref:hypothetical protein n=1 Tax=Fictibacillus phosphorivorans TaxID=1221500 RepID=UPI00203A3F85|nr:hypothetical protein [Fictibacillus phosphorivorans]MCM3719225.1 hypothetical protein [Fictibacillus phosphorivorans]MCM3776847.1 hypothetical protein [Fictibacillus phosphorivorans]